METLTRNKCLGFFIWAYAAVLATALYFSKAIHTVHPAYWYVLSLLAVGMIFSKPLVLALRGRAQEMPCNSKLSIFFIFTLLHGGVAWILGYYLFKNGWQGSLAYPAGALIGFFSYWTLQGQFSQALKGLWLTGLSIFGFVIALRLQAVPGGLAYALALLNTFWLGSIFSKRDDETQGLWLRIIFFTALLAVGRAAIQYYLLQSNYADLGVVITHSYTYISLFAGIFLPMVLWVLLKEKVMPSVLILILLGIGLPLILGVYVHIRPMAGFLLGLVTASFLFGTLFADTLKMGVLSYFSLATVIFGMPLFQSTNNLSRMLRLEILGGLAILMILGFLLKNLITGQETSQSSS